MAEDFSHEDRMDAGIQVMGLFDALEDEDVQQAIRDARQAAVTLTIHLRALGLDNRTCAQLVWVNLFTDFLPD
jgi:hypothetical protein